jgi:hypothetical protein
MRGGDSRPWVTYKSAREASGVNHRDLRPVSGAGPQMERTLGSGNVPCTIDSVWPKPWFVFTPVMSDENWADIITLTKQLGPLQGDAP